MDSCEDSQEEEEEQKKHCLGPLHIEKFINARLKSMVPKSIWWYDVHKKLFLLPYRTATVTCHTENEIKDYMKKNHPERKFKVVSTRYGVSLHVFCTKEEIQRTKDVDKKSKQIQAKVDKELHEKYNLIK